MVHLAWNVSAEGARNHLDLTWHEQNGPPPVTSPAGSGFGSKLIRYSAEHGLGGTAELKYEPAGLEFRLTAPLD